MTWYLCTTWHLSISESTWIQKARVEISFIETRVPRGVWVIIIKNYHTHWFLGQNMRHLDCLTNLMEREREGQLEREPSTWHNNPLECVQFNYTRFMSLLPCKWHANCTASSHDSNPKSFQSGRLKVCYAFISLSCVCFNASFIPAASAFCDLYCLRLYLSLSVCR